jgi:hypothetical protein
MSKPSGNSMYGRKKAWLRAHGRVEIKDETGKVTKVVQLSGRDIPEPKPWK